MTAPTIDWRKLIGDLSASGMSQTQIAHLCNSAQPTISDIYMGRTREPRYALAISLLKLHRKVHRAGKVRGR